LRNDNVPPVGYRYRKFELDEDTTIICRCEVDAAVEGKDENDVQFALVRAFNEWDPKTGVNWRKQLDSQRGAVLATEMHDNANKVAKWCIQSLISGVDIIKLGYVSRALPRDPFRHCILGTQSTKPMEFAQQMNLNIRNIWGIAQ
jgi:translation initiation factor 3 subunit D